MPDLIWRTSVGCEEENYQEDLHDLFLVWNQASTTPLFIGKRGHERPRHPTGQSNRAHQKASPKRMPLFDAGEPGLARRATAAPLGARSSLDPPLRDGPKRGGEAKAPAAR